MNSLTSHRIKNPVVAKQTARHFQWPARTQVLSTGRHASLREFVKYYARVACSLPYRDQFLSTIAGRPGLRDLFASHPRLFHAPLSGFLDRRFSMPRRFTAARTDLHQAWCLLGDRTIRRMALGEATLLTDAIAGYQVTLSLNEVNLQEGSWALSIRNLDGERLYNLSFGFLSETTILIGSIQGARVANSDALDFARHFTKSAHGLRPPCFLLETIRSLCRAWGIREILGIDPTHHIKGRWNQRRSRLKFDYRSFWQEQGALRQASGYWAIDAAAAPKELSTVATRKRSMYRKRFELMDSIGSDIARLMARTSFNFGH